MKRVSGFGIALLLLPLIQEVRGEVADRDFDLPAADVAELPGDGGVGLEDFDFVGNPVRRFGSGFPENLVVAPIPGRSPQVGWSLALGGGYFFESRDEESDVPPSVLGGFGWYAENGSYAYGVGANLHLFDDALRVKLGGGYLDVRYRYYGVGDEQNDRGIALYILQEAPLYFGSLSYRLWKKLYVGLGYKAGSVESRLRFSFDVDDLPDPSLELDVGALTIPLEWDSRDHEQFPTRGWLIGARTSLFRSDLGSDFDAQTLAVEVNHYLPFRQRDVLAFRAFLRATGGDAPFFIKSTFGGAKDLRGYAAGRYRDDMMYALQGEYRWQYSDRWIFTGFAGVGEVASRAGDFGDDFLPAIGVGGRFVLSQKHRVALSFDIAQGRDGAEYYIGIGEAF